MIRFRKYIITDWFGLKLVNGEPFYYKKFVCNYDSNIDYSILDNVNKYSSYYYDGLGNIFVFRHISNFADNHISVIAENLDPSIRKIFLPYIDLKVYSSVDKAKDLVDKLFDKIVKLKIFI